MKPLAIWLFLAALFPLQAAQPKFVLGSPSHDALLLVQSAKTFLKTPYVLGGFSRSGVDCSGFIYAAYVEGIKKEFTRSVFEQAAMGDLVTGQLLPGDLIFFNTTGVSPSHVGIYVGDRKVIHAASQGGETGVIISSLDEDYYKGVYLYAKRIFEPEAPMIQAKAETSAKAWKAPESVKARTRFNLELEVGAYKGRDLDFELYHDQKLVSSRKRNIKTPVIVDRYFLSSPGQWELRVVNSRGQNLARIALEARPIGKGKKL